MAKETPVVVIVKESLLESFAADLGTFGFIILCMWISWRIDSVFWQFVIGTIALAWLVMSITLKTDKVKKFYSVKDAKAYFAEMDEK